MQPIKKKNFRIVGELEPAIVQTQFLEYCSKGTCIIKVGNHCKPTKNKK